MKPQATIKLLTGGMRIGLVLLAGIGSAAAQTSPAQTNNDVRRVLNQAAQANPKAPATANKAPATAKAPETKPATQAGDSQAAAGQTRCPPRSQRRQHRLRRRRCRRPPALRKQQSKPAVQSAAKPAPCGGPKFSAAPEVKEVAERSTAPRRDPFDPLISKDKGGQRVPRRPCRQASPAW